MAYYVIHDTPLGGGTDGIYLYHKPIIFRDLVLEGSTFIYFFTTICLFLVLGFLGLLSSSRFGRALVGIKINELRMRAMGFETYWYKLVAFVISGAIAGIAGFLFAMKDGFVNPEILSWHLSGAVLMMIILGGLGHLRGAVIGAFTYALLEEIFRSEIIFGSFSKNWHLGLGLTLILSVALLPKGLFGIRDQLQKSLPLYLANFKKPPKTKL
jgi:branched-chain amino acid transport system permease protein